MKFCRRLDSNRESLELEATAQSTKPQPQLYCVVTQIYLSTFVTFTSFFISLSLYLNFTKEENWKIFFEVELRGDFISFSLSNEHISKLRLVCQNFLSFKLSRRRRRLWRSFFVEFAETEK